MDRRDRADIHGCNLMAEIRIVPHIGKAFECCQDGPAKLVDVELDQWQVFNGSYRIGYLSKRPNAKVVFITQVSDDVRRLVQNAVEELTGNRPGDFVPVPWHESLQAQQDDDE